ncbi:MAG: hypothetical protein ACFFAO_12260, partial [Candidatus Hermodarchaeota archaeon]
MKELITQQNLNKSIELISEFTFNDNEYEKIFEKLEKNFDNLKIQQLIENISKIQGLENEKDLKLIMEMIREKINLEDLNIYLDTILTNQEL